MSSTQPPMSGSRSLTHLPHWPYCFHSQGLGITTPGLLWNSSTFLAGVQLLAGFADQQRFVVEGVALARRARHE